VRHWRDRLVDEAGSQDRGAPGRAEGRCVNRRRLLAGAAVIGVFAGLRPVLGRAASAFPEGPRAPRRPLRIEQLGRVRVDDYAWLKPDNWKAVWRDPGALSPTIRAYLEEENLYSDTILAPTATLRADLLADMRRGSVVEVDEPPRIDGPWAYFSGFAPRAQHASYYRRPANGGPETLLLDGETRAAGRAFLRIINPAHSADHALFAWAEDASGAEKYVVYVKDLATGEVREGPHDAFGDFVLAPGSAWLFWTWRDASSRPARVYRRPLSGGADDLVYEEADPGFLVHLSLSGSGRFIFIRSWNDITSEVRLIDTRAPTAPPLLAEPRRVGRLYSLEHWNDRFVVLTDADGAEDFKLMLAPESSPQRAAWRDWLPCRPGRTITEMRAFAGHFLRVERVEGNPVLVVGDLAGAWTPPVAFDEAAYALTLMPSAYESGQVIVAFESPRTPKTWLTVDLASGRRTVFARPAIAPDLAPDRFVVERLHAIAADGAQIPVTVLRRADTPMDGSAPVMLTGYGAYGASYETGFSIANLVLADRGWVWAVAHVRGGAEKGRAWFEAARGLKKKTSFTDFIACAEHLVAKRYGRKHRFVTHGYSAGGLLVGAALNMRPDLWAAVIGQAPFVDLLNTMSDASHPLVPLTRPVWGDPLASIADYDNIAGYSPYENVARQPYPPVLATTAVADDRVGFWEPAKWIARLRALSTSGAPMLLHTEMSGGHAGAGGRLDELGQVARTYAFAIWALDLVR
jgi:oligopeptidase B